MSGACGPVGICAALSPFVATATGVSPCIASCCKVRQSKCREIIQKIMIPSAILLAIAAAIIFGWSGPIKTSRSLPIMIESLEEPFTGYGNVLGVVMALAWAIPTVLSCCVFGCYGEQCCKDLKDEVPTDQAASICAKYRLVFVLLVLNAIFPLAVVGFFFWKLQ